MERTWQDELGLYLSLRETETEMLTRARAFQLDLDSALRARRISFVYDSPIDLSPDYVLQELDRAIGENQIQRLVLDGILELGEQIPEANRRATLVRVVAGMFRARGVTVYVPVPESSAAGPELELQRTPYAALAQNLFLLRNVEFEGELYSILSVLNARDSAFDPSIRPYTIRPDGFHLHPAAETPVGLLAGISQLASEARVKRTPKSGADG